MWGRALSEKLSNLKYPFMDLQYFIFAHLNNYTFCANRKEWERSAEKGSLSCTNASGTFARHFAVQGYTMEVWGTLST